jgi:broad specificity phosphatase PhoE
MIPAKEFYMIRHGQSEANRDQYFSGNLDVALTDLGREQAALAGKAVKKLPKLPRVIVHSHLSRAKDTAAIINKSFNIPMIETDLLGEHHFGDWEKQPWEKYRPLFYQGHNPPNGETHEAFHSRVKKGFNYALNLDESPALIVCHGGIFRALHAFYKAPFERTENAKLYHFKPTNNTPEFPWEITLIE